MAIVTIQDHGSRRPPTTVAAVKVAVPGLAGGDWFFVQAAASNAAYEWPACEGRRVFSDAAALVADCGVMEVYDGSDPAAQAVVAAWPQRTIFGKPVQSPG